MPWPATAAELERTQIEIAALTPPAWEPGDGPIAVAGCFVCFRRGVSGAGAAGEPAWAAAVVTRGDAVVAEAVVEGVAGAPYEPGLLALREGPLLEDVMRALPLRPDVLLVDATGRDHPRRCGLALHLGYMLDLPTVGVTHRPLQATGDWPQDITGASSPLTAGGERVGYWLRPHAGTRPLAVHTAWRTSPETALRVFLQSLGRSRTPEPLRLARQRARLARQQASGA